MAPEYDHLKKAKETAEAALRGDIPILEAACSLRSALIHTRLEKTGPAMLFNGVCSETDDLPIGRVREYWATAALTEKDRQAADYETRVRIQFLEACREIIRLIGETTSE